MAVRGWVWPDSAVHILIGSQLTASRQTLYKSKSSPDTCAARTAMGETQGTEMTFWFSVLCNPPQTEAMDMRCRNPNEMKIWIK